MTSLWHALKTGRWLTRERMQAYCLIVGAAGFVALIGWIVLADGLIARDGQPIGTDFSNPYAAGKLLWEGRAADAYVPALQHDAEIAVFGRDVPFYGWHYPPFFFAIAALVATMPYLWGLTAWLALSLAGYLAAIHAILPRRETLWAALAFPAVFVNLGHGQNGFLTAALLSGALHVLHRSPLLAGVLIGLLAYKPQFGILIPLALLAGGYWRTVAAAAATVAALCVASWMLMGTEIWVAFLRSTKFTQVIVLEQGGTGWEKIQSIFSAVRAMGGSINQAYTAQGVLAICLAANLVWLWRSKASFDLKASALATASLLATPYVLDYDLTVLAIALVFFARDGLARGFAPYSVTLAAAVWIVPLVSRSVAGATGVPLGLIAMMMLYAMTLHRVRNDLGLVKRRHAAVAKA